MSKSFVGVAVSIVSGTALAWAAACSSGGGSGNGSPDASGSSSGGSGSSGNAGSSSGGGSSSSGSGSGGGSSNSSGTSSSATTSSGGSSSTSSNGGTSSGTGSSGGSSSGGSSSSSGAGGSDAGHDAGGSSSGGNASSSSGSSSDGGACPLAVVNVLSAANFAVLAGSTVTNSGPTAVTGDLGVSPGTAVTGFPPGTMTGTQHVDAVAAQAEADLTTAYNDGAGRTLCPIGVAGNLGGQTLSPGLYRSTSSLEVSSGDLTLDARGNSSAVWIFQMASTLTTTSGRQVVLAGGAQARNVFWQVGSSATLGTTSAFQGTIMADQSITMATGATLNGRVLARTGAVTLDGNTIVSP